MKFTNQRILFIQWNNFFGFSKSFFDLTKSISECNGSPAKDGFITNGYQVRAYVTF